MTRRRRRPVAVLERIADVQAPAMTLDELARDRPDVYFSGAMLTYAQAVELAGVVDAELVEASVAGDEDFTPEERAAVVELVRAARAFADALKTARERGVLL